MRTANAIDFAIRQIRARIPDELITKAFKPDYRFQRYDMITPEWLIRKEVIENFVLADLEVVAGQHITIDLSRVIPREMAGARIYQIPLSMTENRHLSRVIAVDYGGMNGYVNTNDPLADGMEKMLTANGSFTSTGTADVELIGPNTVAMFEHMSGTMALRAVIGYDDNMSSLDRAYYRDFAMLCVRAVEMTIYNRMSIVLGSGSSTGGSPNSYLRQRLDEMAQSAELYDELCDRFIKIGILSDHKTHLEHLRLMIG